MRLRSRKQIRYTIHMYGLIKLYFSWSAYWKSSWANVADPQDLNEVFKADRIRVLSGNTTPEKIQLILEADNLYSPQWIAGRLKGRINHQLRKTIPDFPGFDRSFLLQSLGQNDRSIVSHYVQNQVNSSELVDPLYRRRMNELRFHEEGESKASTSHRGRYDLVVHIVLVIANRHRIFSQEARKVFEALLGASEIMGLKAFDISMMPDHAHLMLGWPSTISANELVEGLKAESGKIMRRRAYWQNGGYVGTVGPYRLSVAVEKNHQKGGW